MGYEVSRRRVYGSSDRYCGGSGISVLVSTLEEAEARYADFATNDAGYPAAVFLIGGGEVIKHTGPSVVDVDRAMMAAYRRKNGGAA